MGPFVSRVTLRLPCLRHRALGTLPSNTMPMAASLRQPLDNLVQTEGGVGSFKAPVYKLQNCTKLRIFLCVVGNGQYLKIQTFLVETEIFPPDTVKPKYLIC
jgi:hypothetical protein